MSEDELANDVIKDYNRLREGRYNHEEHWREVSEYFNPPDRTEFSSLQASNKLNRGEKRNFLFDSTSQIALGRFTAIMDSLLTPSHSRWQALVADNDDLMKIRRVALFFEEATKQLFKYRYLPGANFAAQNNKVYHSVGAYGTGLNYVDRHYLGRGLRYKSVHLSQAYISENHQGVVDKVIRAFPLTLRAAYGKWGDDLPEELIRKLPTSPEQEYVFLHRVAPNMDYDPERADFKGMKYSSVYVVEHGRKTLEVGGYRESFPYAVSRYIQAEREVYGRSPAMQALVSTKTLNEQKKTVLKQGQRIVDPIYLSHDQGILDTWGARPGTVNPGAVTADGRLLVHALPTGNIAVGDALIQDERAIINDVFFVTLFQILTESPQMTATEVLERVREKGVLLSPTLGRQESEYLGYITERELELLGEQGLLPEMPPELLEAGGEYKVVYNSPMARARKAEEATGTMRALEFGLQMATNTQDMSWLDWFDPDKIIPMLADTHGMPLSMRRSLEQVKELRESRSAARQEEAEVAAMPGQAALIKSAATASKEANAA